MASRPQVSTPPKSARTLPDAYPALVPTTGLPESRNPGRTARIRTRHVLILLSFLLMVIAPVGTVIWYMMTRAQPQFAAKLGFVIHQEGTRAPTGLLSSLPGIGAIGGSASKDTDILARYLQSHAVVAQLEDMVGLRAQWSQGHGRDPIFAFDPAGTVEDLTRFWQRMVRVHHDYASGLMEVEVRSFSPDHAYVLAKSIEASSSRLINELSSIARDDRLRHATEELHRTEEALGNARRELTSFRAHNLMVDPMADLQNDLQLIATLQQQLTEEKIAHALLIQNLAEAKSGARREISGDLRIRQSNRRINVIKERISEEKGKIGGKTGGTSYAELTGEFERLLVRVEIAQQAQLAAFTARETARAEADLQSRYIATYASAERPERALYPRSGQIVGTTVLGAMLVWSVGLMFVYGLRDRV